MIDSGEVYILRRAYKMKQEKIKSQLDSSNSTSLKYLKRGSEEYYANFIGKTFRELTILNVEKIKVGSRNVWKGTCRCSCGEMVVRRLYGVIHGYTKSCGHLRAKRRESYEQFVGKTFGELTILSIIKTKENSKLVWKCECHCSCGREVTRSLISVLRGHTKSCGHLFKNRKQAEYAQFVGKTIGELTILNLIDSREDGILTRTFECFCSCGKKVNVLATSVANGYTKSCGHLRRKWSEDYNEVIGEKFGELTILSIEKTKEGSKIIRRCECLCSCGKKVNKRLYSVLNGVTKSCGHLRLQKRMEHSQYIGKIYGELTILDIVREKAKRSFVYRAKCLCSCGKIAKPRLSAILSGKTKSCGHLAMSLKINPTQYIGQTFGELTILNVTESEEGSKVVRRCECLCSCGRKTNPRLHSVLYGNTKSCGHLAKYPKENFTRFIGRKFGELTIVGFVETRENSKLIRYFECVCSCGKKTTKQVERVLQGKTKSCGHLQGIRTKRDRANLIGKKFGELTIIDISEPITELNSNRNRISTCRCSCGKETKVPFYHVINGYVKSCGHCTKGVRKKDYSYLIRQKIGELIILSYAGDPETTEGKNDFLCKCSCGKELVLPIDKIVSGKIFSCPECKTEDVKKEISSQESEECLMLGMRNIHWDEREQRFVVAVKRAGKWFKARAKTLEEAIEKREQKLREAEEFAKTSKLIEETK